MGQISLGNNKEGRKGRKWKKKEGKVTEQTPLANYRIPSPLHPSPRLNSTSHRTITQEIYLAGQEQEKEEIQ